MRDVGRVMGMPYGFCDTLAKLVPFEVGMTLEKALAQDDELRRRFKNEAEVTQLIENGLRLEGMPRNAGKHAGGLLDALQSLGPCAVHRRSFARWKRRADATVIKENHWKKR